MSLKFILASVSGSSLAFRLFSFRGLGTLLPPQLKWVDEGAAEMLAATHTTKSRVEMLKNAFRSEFEIE
jgi:hypothetical protein